MHSIQFILVSAAALASSPVFAHSGFHHQARGVSPFKHGNSNIFKRQATAVDSFPPECADKCKSYLDVGANCAGIAQSEQQEDLSQEDILACACTSEFFAATVSCVACAPQTFQAGGDYTPKQIVQLAQTQCKTIGHEVTGVDLSPLDNLGDDSGAAPSGSIAGNGNGNAVKGGSSSIDDNGNDAVKAGIADHGAAATDGEATTTPAAVKTPPAGATKIPAGAVADESSTVAQSAASASAAAGGTGAGVINKAQHVLASFVAVALGAICFL